MRSRHTIALASLIALCAIASCSNTHQDNAVEPLDPANYPTTPDTTTTTTTPGSQTTTTTASSTTTPPTDTTAVTSLSGQPGIDVPDSVKQELIQAYQKSIAAFYEAAANPRPAETHLPDFFAGEALTKIQTEIARFNQVGIEAFLPTPTKSQQRLELVRVFGPTHAEIETCAIDDGVERYLGGQVINEEVSIYRSIIAFEHVDGVWKRSGSGIIAKGNDSKCVF